MAVRWAGSDFRKVATFIAGGQESALKSPSSLNRETLEAMEKLTQLRNDTSNFIIDTWIWYFD